MAEVDAARKVYCFPLGVQRTSSPHAHFFGSCYISNGVGIILFGLLIRGFSGPKATNWQIHRYPAFFLCLDQLIMVASSLGICWRKHKGQEMKRFKMKPKMLLLVAVVLLFPIGMIAQNGMFQRSVSDEANCGNGSTNGLMNRSESTIGYFSSQGFGAANGSLTGQGFGVTNGNITGQTFGVPLGSGLFVLLTAGIGYSALKSKKTTKQNRKEK